MSAAAPLPVTNDFADWLSPILVKELRQGMQARTFVSIFIVVQVVMILLVGFHLLSLSTNAGTSGFDGFFWIFVGFPLLVLMPARGLAAVSEELRANTLDLVRLTRLTAFRIILGKWVALVSQSGLLVAAILPYAVLRYFFGRVDVILELETLGWMLAASFVITAGTIALSTAHLVLRVLILLAALPAFLSLMSAYAFSRAFGGGGYSSGSFVPVDAWWLILTVMVVYVVMFLEYAASKIAPLSENHSARKRSAVLLFSIILMVAGWLGGASWLILILIPLVPIIVWVIVEALTEKSVLLPSLFKPFARRGSLGRMAGRFLYPGWATGVMFTALVVGLIFLAFSGATKIDPILETDRLQFYAVWMLVLLSLLVPLPIIFLFKRVERRFWLYLLIQLVFVLLFAAASTVSDRDSPSSFYWLAPFPTSALIAMLSHSEHAELAVFFLKTTSVMGGGLLLFLAFVMRREFRVFSSLENAAVDSLKKKSAM